MPLQHNMPLLAFSISSNDALCLGEVLFVSGLRVLNPCSYWLRRSDSRWKVISAWHPFVLVLKIKFLISSSASALRHQRYRLFQSDRLSAAGPLSTPHDSTSKYFIKIAATSNSG
jgi:hypothetical protein